MTIREINWRMWPLCEGARVSLKGFTRDLRVWFTQEFKGFYLHLKGILANVYEQKVKL